MHLVYVLRNQNNGRHYTGYTTDLTRRLGQHNGGITKSTKNRGHWEMLYHEEFASRAEAMKREKFLKTGKGREELRRILEQGARSSVG
jgi:putative endonuclease